MHAWHVRVCVVQMCVCQLMLKSLRLPDHRRGLAKP